jgi:hypothetical protein
LIYVFANVAYLAVLTPTAMMASNAIAVVGAFCCSAAYAEITSIFTAFQLGKKKRGKAIPVIGLWRPIGL